MTILEAVKKSLDPDEWDGDVAVFSSGYGSGGIPIDCGQIARAVEDVLRSVPGTQGQAIVWYNGSQQFYWAILLRKMSSEEVERERLQTADELAPKRTQVLGARSPVPNSPAEAELDLLANMSETRPYIARFTCPEFTSLCPVTGQPDFATLVIDYVPRELLVESKSLKLFLFSFRNYGAFHEECTMMVARKIVDAAHPLWFRIAAYWNPRGGIPIDVFWETGKLPEGLEKPRLRGPLAQARTIL